MLFKRKPFFDNASEGDPCHCLFFPLGVATCLFVFAAKAKRCKSTTGHAAAPAHSEGFFEKFLGACKQSSFKGSLCVVCSF